MLSIRSDSWYASLFLGTWLIVQNPQDYQDTTLNTARGLSDILFLDWLHKLNRATTDGVKEAYATKV